MHTAAELIKEFGEKAHAEAVRLLILYVTLRDHEAIKHYAKLAKELEKK